jgi:hypothetical protein
LTFLHEEELRAYHSSFGKFECTQARDCATCLAPWRMPRFFCLPDSISFCTTVRQIFVSVQNDLLRFNFRVFGQKILSRPWHKREIVNRAHFLLIFLLSRRFQISMFFFESIAPLEAWSHQKAPAIFYSRENLLGTRKHRLKSKFALEISANRHGSCEGMESSEGPCRSANAQCGQRSGTPLS